MGITHSADMNDICTTLDPNYEPKFQVAQIGAYSDDMKNRLRANYPKITPFFFSDPPQAAYAALKKVVKNEARWTIKREDDDEFVVEFEATTALMKFTDDAVFQVKPWGDGGSVLNMRSRSRVGAGDWGANYKRMRYLVSKSGLNLQKAPANFEARSWTAPGQIDIDAPRQKKTPREKEPSESVSSISSSSSSHPAEQPAEQTQKKTEKKKKKQDNAVASKKSRSASSSSSSSVASPSAEQPPERPEVYEE
eukprot:TRINITY_DN2604_c0_g1_i2.p1 TRINITY_DN2604_c0_g1~~TRINITY_DN2604_c0_g1_i2.p1  ORF type:complete len:262 (-),score=62.88 TRINITY_DN2604_c0_g1_i2:77-829(-)